MKATESLTVSSVSVLDLYESLRDEGYVGESDVADLLQARSALLDVEGRWPAETVVRLWQLAIARGASCDVGLRVGECLNDNHRGMLSNLIISANTLGEAVRLFQRYLPVMSQVDTVTVQPVAAGLKLSYGFRDSRLYSSVSVARSMSAAVAWARYLTGQPIEPVAAYFCADNVRRPEEYRRVFGDHCRFAMTEDALVLATDDLQRPLRQANHYVHTIIRDRVEDVQKLLARGDGLAEVVRQVIAEDLHRGGVTSEYVASRLNISRQTLHRRLSRDGVSFRSLLADTRRERARRYLKQGDGKIEHLSELLGYSEPSAFFKAFRSWFGCSPRQFALIEAQRRSSGPQG